MTPEQIWLKYWANPIRQYYEKGRNAYFQDHANNTFTDNPYNRETEPEKYHSWAKGQKDAYDDQTLVDMGR